jgi:hypothetical protein
MVGSCIDYSEKFTLVNTKTLPLPNPLLRGEGTGKKLVRGEGTGKKLENLKSLKPLSL